ncbi:interleukin-1 receptor type 2-like isoform X2 [Mobula birostris]|uniref:interleukin-1 receptor type 2-like isoform X2 n=1 Tax=Mobula birostris TaxID=1983395 RepID=UPI003B283869
MIVLLAVFVSLCISVSSSNVCETAAQNKSTKGHTIQILYPCNNTIEAVVGSKLEVTCTVLAELHPAEILVYWLANQTFIEEYSRDNRIKETESERKGTEKSYLDATLNFSKVERKDFAVTFVCVILSGETDLARYISIKPAGITDAIIKHVYVQHPSEVYLLFRQDTCDLLSVSANCLKSI